ncbi:MAG: M48 family metallopeptidase [Leptolyngbyaceae cyanobacterium MO_188.B28]|nr:M48 family metallopeptidase [Leptolyngbyaceae cyanobacterium MO_188.B28]
MNFFEHQDQARQNTKQLMGLFGLAIAGMILSIYAVVVIALLDGGAGGWWRPEVLFLVSLGTLAVVGSGSAYKILQLRQGGMAVAENLGGRLVNLQTRDPREQTLLNVVEEIAIASGTPIPAVYLLEYEPGINAFAAGYTPNDAVIGVTRGCLEHLDRDELQGVIAHEFSHILNGDMRLNIQLIGVLQGILLIYIIGRVFLRSAGSSRRRSRREKGNGIVFIGLALMGIGGVGLLCGRLIKSAVSRQREFLADASAVQFTRNPSGISSALKKLGGFIEGSRIDSPKAEEASHLFFGNALSPSFFLNELFATHPPLEERIQRLDNFAGQTTPLPKRKSSTQARGRTANALVNKGGVMGFQSAGAVKPPGASPIRPGVAPINVAPEQIVQQVGTADPEHLTYAHAFLSKMPEQLRAAIRNRQGALAVIYGLLLDSKAEIREKQLDLLRQSESVEFADKVSHLSQYLQKLAQRTHLVLLDLTIPALRTSTPQQYIQLFNQIKELVRADGVLSLSEYVMQLILYRRLKPYFSQDKDLQIKYTKIEQIWLDCVTLLSALARIGQTSPDAIAYAFRSGLFCLPGAGSQDLPKEPRRCSLQEIGQSLNRLELAAPKLKQAVVDACAHTVLVDNEVTNREAELLRAIVIALNCPIPPFLEKTK